jgi:excisionase family DNA binding protein
MLDTGQAGRYLRLARQTLAKLRCIGGSPAFYKVGRQVLYDRADLDAWLEKRRRRSTSDPGPSHSNGDS